MTKTTYLLVHLLVGSLVFLVPSTVALGNELWIPGPPDKKEVFGNLVFFPFHPTSRKAQFRFVVPDNFTAFRAAKVEVIAYKSNPITYDLHLSVSQDGLPKDHFTDWMHDLGPLLLVENEILEIDVSTIFPLLAPGNLVKLRFETNPGRVKTLAPLPV